MRKWAIVAAVVCCWAGAVAAQSPKQIEAEQALKERQEKLLDGLLEQISNQSRSDTLARHRGTKIRGLSFGEGVDDFLGSLKDAGYPPEVVECEADSIVKTECTYRIGQFRWLNLLVVSFNEARRIHRISITLPNPAGSEVRKIAVKNILPPDAAGAVLSYISKMEDPTVKRVQAIKGFEVRSSSNEMFSTLFLQRK